MPLSLTAGTGACLVHPGSLHGSLHETTEIHQKCAFRKVLEKVFGDITLGHYIGDYMRFWVCYMIVLHALQQEMCNVPLRFATEKF